MEYFVALLFVVALVQVYISARRRARQAVDQLDRALHTVELEDKAAPWAARKPCLLENGRELLAQAEQALDERDWDRAEEICRFAASALGLEAAEQSASVATAA